MANRKLICHEMPRELETSWGYDINDYSYYLLHKLIEDPDYCRRAILTAAHSRRLQILDNSCYELGASLDNAVLYHYYKLIQPTALIYPDVLGNMADTLTRSRAFKEAYPDTWGTSMLVAQGSSRMELISCYEEIVESEWSKDCFMIGIPFVFSWIDKDPTKQADERIALLREMDVLGIIRQDKKHHLLGTWQAREFAEYRDYDWIYSVDTSNPIMAALEGIKYTETGLVEKPKANFDSTYNTKLVDIDIDLVYYNVKTFRRIVNG